MNQIITEIVATQNDADEMDNLLWQILWEPLGLPRDIRQKLSVDGEQLELATKDNGRIVGGLVAVWTNKSEAELRHLAVTPDAQNRGIGRRLVAALLEIILPRGCRRIHTISRNTSTGFFKKLGFTQASGKAPEHAAFKNYGVTFELLERNIEPTGADDALKPD
jgi:N-acetylglutamate synthase-like GNAT family acetyltransferase